MMSYLLFVSVCWTILYLLYVGFMRRETFFELNRWYLLSSLLIGLLIPAVNLIPDLLRPEAEVVAVYFEPLRNGVVSVQDHLASNTASWSVSSVWVLLKWIYLGGVLWMLGRFVYGLFRIHVLVRMGKKYYRPNHVIVETDRAHSPFSFFKWIFVSPSILRQTEFQHILKHELCHVKGRHTWDVLFIECLRALFWFNPLIYLYKKAIRQTHEYLADAGVVRDVHRKIYGHLLLRQSRSGLETALAHHFFHSHLKKRIMMLYRKKSGQPALLKYLAVVPLVLLLAIVFSSHSKADMKSDLHFESSLDTVPLQLGDATLDKDVFKVVEEMPRFPGCEELYASAADRDRCAKQKMLAFIGDHLRYPEAAKKQGIEGKAVVSFVVDERGYLKDVRVRKDPGGGCGKAAWSVVREMPQPWTPGKHKGQAVAVEFSLPIQFKLGKGDAIDAPKPPKPPQPDRIGTPPSAPKAPAAPASPAKDLPTPPQPPAPPTAPEAYKVVEEMPRFPGCEHQAMTSEERRKCAQKAMLQYIYENLKYPKTAQKAGVEGTVVVRFVVDVDGSVKDVEVLRDIGAGCGDAARAVVTSMNDMDARWTPGKMKQKAVPVQFTLPMRFKLQSKDQKQDKAIEQFKQSVETSVTKELELQRFSITPNPSKDQLSLRFETEPGSVEVRLSDAQGRLLKRQNGHSSTGQFSWTFDISNVQSEFVLVSVLREDRIYTERVIISR